MPEPTDRQSIKVQAERTMLAAVRLPGSTYDERDPFGELRELAVQAGAVVISELEQRLQKPVAGTYMGKGKLEELKNACAELNIATIIFDHDLSPRHIAKIEEATNCKILDRSELILDIFASRAVSHEAKLQVEIAQLEYTYPRLRAMWSHLERIVGSGGIGGLGTRGPGEQQLEIDRRLVQNRKSLLGKELKDIQERKRRAVEKRNNDHFTVGLVGYTNAGKSTIFNTLTEGGAYADDRLFATLMTRTREWNLGGGHNAMLSDTVGFVRDLPHHLVASFRATLEEAMHADLILIVLDIADKCIELHYETVLTTLDELFEEVEKREDKLADTAKREGKEFSRYQRPEYQVLLNKADKLTDTADLLYWQSRIPGSIPLCSLPAKEGDPAPLGQEDLIARVKTHSLGTIQELNITIPLSDSKTIHTIENRTEVTERDYVDQSVTLRTKIGTRQLAHLRARGANMTVHTLDGTLIDAPKRTRGWTEDSDSPYAKKYDF